MRNKIKISQPSDGEDFVLLPCKLPKVNIKFDKLFGWFISKEFCMCLCLVESFVLSVCVRACALCKHHGKSDFSHVEVVNVESKHIHISHYTITAAKEQRANTGHLEIWMVCLFLEEWRPNRWHSYQGYYVCCAQWFHFW